MRPNIIIAALSALTLVACQRNKQDLTDEVSFRVDHAVLGVTFQDSVSRISIRVPKGWESIEEKTDSVSAKIKDALKANGQNSRVRKIYLDQSTLLSSLAILQIDKSDSLRIQTDYQNPDSAFNIQKRWKSINKAEFTYHGIKVMQFILFNDQVVNIKLICSKTGSIEFNFFLTQEEYKRNVKKIESSIGSITFVN